MRPLLVDLGREFRGGQHQALLLLDGLRERGHAPELIAVRDSLLAIRAKEAGIPVYPADPRRRRITAAIQIRKLVEERAIDVIHANEPHALTSAWLALAHRTVPIVVSRRIALPLSQNNFSRMRYEAAARVVAVSHFVQQSVIQSGLPADRVSVIYDGVRIPAAISETERETARQKLGIASGNLCIGNVAAFVPEKGHALLIQAFAKLRAKFPGCVLLLRGEGPERAALESLAENFQAAEAVKFLPVSVEIETLFAALDVFAFPSHEEPLGSALLAAMAHALPVVAIARGGIPEVVKNRANGMLVNDLDPEAFASAIASLLEHREESARFGVAAREAIVARFSSNRMVEETAGLCEDLIAGRTRSKSAE